MRKLSPENLRHRPVTFVYDGRSLIGVVITRIRGTRWMIESPQLPKRITLDRSEFTVSAIQRPFKPARTILDRMIDKACGLD